MKTRSEVERVTGLTRKKIQNLEQSKIINKRTSSSGIAYEYTDEEINTLMIAKFLKDCNYENKEIKEMLEDYPANKDELITKAIISMEIKIKKLKQNIEFANNMLNTDLSVWDISKMYNSDSSLGYEDIVTIFGYASKLYSKDLLDKVSDNIKIDDIMEHFLDFLDNFEKDYSNNNFKLIEFNEGIECFIQEFSERIGCYSIKTIEMVFCDDYLLNLYDKKFIQQLTKEVEFYLKNIYELSIEYKLEKAISFIWDNIENYTFDSDVIQNELNKIYAIECLCEKFGFDALLSMEFRGNLFDSIIVKYTVNNEEKVKMKAIANAFKYFVQKKRK